MLSLALLFVLVFYSPLSNAITSHVEDRTGLCDFRAFVCWFVSLSSSSWRQGLAATFNCGTPWNFPVYPFVPKSIYIFFVLPSFNLNIFISQFLYDIQNLHSNTYKNLYKIGTEAYCLLSSFPNG